MRNIKRSGDYLIGDVRDTADAYKDMFKSPGNNVDIKQAADMMKKLLEMEDLMGMQPKRPRSFSYDKIVAASDANKAKIEQLQKEQDLLKRAIEYVATLPFKEGDAAFHKDHGNILINNIIMDDGLNHDTTYYSIMLKSGKRIEVPMKEVVPITEATKILFGKK